MEDHARTRLARFGSLCTSLGAAAQIMGRTLTEFDAAAADKANFEIRDLLLDGAATCEVLAQYSVDTAHLDPAYDEEDATAVALLFRMLDHMGSVVAQLSELSLFDLPGVKYETWVEVATHLREAAAAANNRGIFHAQRAQGHREDDRTSDRAG